MALEFPDDLKYLDTHEYARVDEDETIVTVGISAFALDQLGDIVFLELPDVGDTVEKRRNLWHGGIRQSGGRSEIACKWRCAGTE